MKKVCDFVCNHVCFGFDRAALVSLLTLFVIIPAMMFLPERCGYENGLLENIQMVVLFVGVYFAFNPKLDKKFFNFVAMVLIILIIREVNCGRTIFFAIPGQENAFYRWSEIKYGWLAHPIYGLYMAYVAFYFFKNKLFVKLWEKLRDIKFPIWNFILMLIGIIGGLYGEEVHNMVVEEATELLFYVALVGFVYLYSRNENFIK